MRGKVGRVADAKDLEVEKYIAVKRVLFGAEQALGELEPKEPNAQPRPVAACLRRRLETTERGERPDGMNGCRLNLTKWVTSPPLFNSKRRHARRWGCILVARGHPTLSSPLPVRRHWLSPRAFSRVTAGT